MARGGNGPKGGGAGDSGADQTIIGTNAGEKLSGGSGNDRITGLGGNDQINGGDGTDTAVFSGTADGYA